MTEVQISTQTDGGKKMADINGYKPTDEELEKIGGGINTNVPTRRSECPRCDKETVFYLYTGGRAICSDCGYEKMM